ncbi:MAG: ribosome biogenesis GTPase YlqF [Lachnospiraceae bacterium]|nr:ribosome biogenesis GTPase YlqF [Lachnospiraceae bacterium]
MNIQWYPGHMTKAKRAMEEAVKLIDLVIELVDARAPLSSRNPEIDQLGKGKARLILLNKADLADERANDLWISYFSSMGFQAVKLNCRSGAGLKQIQGAVMEACKEKLERDKRKGIQNRPIRAMVAGIPNVGKSTFINAFAKKSCTKTGNKPGVTKGNQWIRLSKWLELLDTPGILWPKFEDQEVGRKLAFIGSINDDILNKEELALELINLLLNWYPQSLTGRFGIDKMEALSVLEEIGRVRGCLQKGGGLDMGKAANVFFDDFRSGKLGRITLELPENTGEMSENAGEVSENSLKPSRDIPGSISK